MYAISDFGNKTPTHMGAAHAISKIEQKFQNRVPRKKTVRSEEMILNVLNG